MGNPTPTIWYEAAKKEFDGVATNTFQLFDLPYDQSRIPGRWVFELKRNTDGTIARYKV
jgi:hypothetical protein